MTIGIISSRCLFRRALAALLLQSGAVKVAWHRESPEGEGPGDARADVVLLDAPNDTIDRLLIQQTKVRFPGSKLAVLYENINDTLVLESILAGAHGCFSKVRDGEIIVEALQRIARGEVWAKRTLIAQALHESLNHSHEAEQVHPKLTRREAEIFSLVASGKRNREIAERVYVSEQTVKRHVYNLFRKLGITTRLEAGLLFYQMAPSVRSGDLPLQEVNVSLSAQPGVQQAKIPAQGDGMCSRRVQTHRGHVA